MSVDISSTYLVEVVTSQAVEAELWNAITEQQLIDWEDKWKPEVDAAVQRLKAQGVDRSRLPQSRHWNWRRKAQDSSGILAKPSFCVMCQGVTQGMMILDTLQNARLKMQAGKSIIYIEYLEVAPWNRRDLITSLPRYQPVGSILVRAAIESSQQQGFKGRLGLHSLPQSDDYYRKVCGMTDLGADPNYQNLRYFEMTPEMAGAFIAKGNKP